MCWLVYELPLLQLQCCGVNNYTDWYDIKDRGQQVRPSCCVDPSPGCEKSQSFLWNTKVFNFYFFGGEGGSELLPVSIVLSLN